MINKAESLAKKELESNFELSNGTLSNQMDQYSSSNILNLKKSVQKDQLEKSNLKLDMLKIPEIPSQELNSENSYESNIPSNGGQN